MAPSHRPGVLSRPVRAVRRLRSITRVFAVGAIATLAYAGLTQGIRAPIPDLADLLPSDMPVALASLSPQGTAAPLTSAYDQLFASASFTGPNRAAKTDRVRPQVDALALSKSFTELRVHLASLRGIDPAELGQSRVADAVIDGPKQPEGPRMSVASIDPAAAAALDAIAGIAPSTASLGVPASGNPMPMIASEQLAYARANAPVTGPFALGEKVAVSDKERWCLATAIYFEARGENYRGQVAVAQVVMNRVKDRRYPDTICGVVYQNQNKRNSCQFSFACDGIPETINDTRSWAQAQDIAQRTVDGELYLAEVGDATHYHATYVRPAWAPRMVKVTQIGLHVFYKFKRGWLFG